MHRALCFAAAFAATSALACENHLPLEGTLEVETCRVGEAGCVYAPEALSQYFGARPEKHGVLVVGIQGSPWRVYDADSRILTIDEFVALMRPNLEPGDTAVELHVSWSGVSPEPGVPSLAERVSKAMGLPATGLDGFAWIDRAGNMRTTHQAFTGRFNTGPYGVKEGAEVLIPLASSWAAGLEDKFPDDPDLQLRAAVGWDIFWLCPDKALAGFERAAAKGSAIGAYNAGLMRAERMRAGDAEAAIALFERGAALGDARSAERASKLRALIQ